MLHAFQERSQGTPKGRPRTGENATRTALVTSGLKGDPDYEEFDSVWKLLGFSPQECANLSARADLMMQVEGSIREKSWTPAVAAKKSGVSQPRMNSLLRHNIDQSSIDTLVNIAASLGLKVQIALRAA